MATVMQGELSEYPGYIVYSNGKIYSRHTQEFIGYTINGYNEVKLKHLNGFYESIRIHKLIAQVFVINDEPDTKKIVEHIDKNKLNNDYTNLRWVKKLRDKNKKRRKAVCQYTLDRQFLKRFTSIADASEETGIDPRQITKCCNLKPNAKIGKRIKYRWRYDENGISDEHIVPVGKTISNLSKYIICDNGCIWSMTLHQYVTMIPTTEGFMRVRLINDSGRGKSYFVHQLVIEAYCSVSYSQINHKNGDRKDNRLENLEYVDESRKRKRN